MANKTPTKNARLIRFARDNRAAQSASERALWAMMRNRRLGVKVRRQHPIGPYIADFAVVEAMLVIEADGLSHGIDDFRAADERRDAYLGELGWRVLRLCDARILSDPSGTEKAIRAALHEALTPNPSPKGRGGEE